MTSIKHESTGAIHADASRIIEQRAGHLGCRRCLQPLGSAMPSRCPECGLALDPANPRSVCDLRARKRSLACMTALGWGIVAGGLLGFGWWFAMQHNQWMPMLNVIGPLAFLGAAPAVLLARLPRARPAIAYAFGSMSFLVWATLAIAIDQLMKGVPIAGLNIDLRTTLLVGVPVTALAIAVGIGIGCALRLVLRRARRHA